MTSGNGTGVHQMTLGLPAISLPVGTEAPGTTVRVGVPATIGLPARPGARTENRTE